MLKRVVLTLIALCAAAALSAAPAQAKSLGLFPCGGAGATPNGVDMIKARKLSCVDARTVVRRVTVNFKAQCRPQTDATIAPYRICDVQVALSGGGTPTFHCVGTIESQYHYRERCSSPGNVRVQWRRTFAASDGRR